MCVTHTNTHTHIAITSHCVADTFKLNLFDDNDDDTPSNSAVVNINASKVSNHGNTCTNYSLYINVPHNIPHKC